VSADQVLHLESDPYLFWTRADVATPEECATAISSLPAETTAAWQGNVEVDRPQPAGRRTRPRPWLSLPRLPEVALALFDRAAEVAGTLVNGGLDETYAGAFVVREGHGSDVHVDRNHGRRKYTFILYLNEVRRGGELQLVDDATGRPRLLAPRAGDLVVLPLTPLAWHGVETVARGTRYSLAGHLLHEDGVCDVVNPAWWVDTHPDDLATSWVGP
jgi:hypothetical protein